MARSAHRFSSGRARCGRIESEGNLITREFLLSIAADAEFARLLYATSAADWPDLADDLRYAISRLDQLIAAIHSDADTAAVLDRVAHLKPAR